MKNNTTFFIVLILFVIPFTSAAQGTYYNNVEAQVANGLNCMPLKQALHDLIDGHTVRSYNDVSDFMCINDLDANGNILDRYKGTNVPCSGTSLPSGILNREHVLPRSWWGGSTGVTQYSDFHNLFPSDQQANSDKSAYPLGVVGSSIGNYPCPSFPFTDIGLDGLNCTNINAGTNFDDNVFEPDNSYKGDFARVFLYMAVRYQDEIITGNWKGTNATTNAVFSNDILTIYEPCLLNLLLQWHNQDAPSQLEIDRNNAIALATNQGNRNPFIDHPEYADLVWNTTCTGNPPPNGLCERLLDNCEWTPVSVVTNTGTQPTWICASGSYNINAYTASNNPSEQWLVYGPIDMSATTTANLVLDIAENYSGPQLEFMWNATSGSPTAAGWNSVVMAGSTAVTGYTVNYSAAVGNSAVYLGIKYTATGAAGGTQAFTLSNLKYQENCCASMELDINFDGFPTQTSWDIVDDNGTTVASGSSYMLPGNSSTTESTCLPDGCYTLNFYDALNNGMCPFRATATSAGTFITPGTLITPGSVVATLGTVVAPGLCGNYNLSDANGTTLASGGGGFGASQANTFCISGGVGQIIAPNNDLFFDAKIQEDTQFNIRPNIIQDEIHINYFTKNNNVQFYITNVNGQILGEYLGNGNNDITLNVSHLQAGYYFVQMISEGEVVVEKFFKN